MGGFSFEAATFCVSLQVVIGESSGLFSIVDEFSFYPNPFRTSISILLDNASQINNYELIINNVLGVNIMKTEITNPISEINFDAIVSGVYFYKIIFNNKEVQSGKMICVEQACELRN